MAQGPNRRGSRRGAASRLNLILSVILIVIVVAIVGVLILNSRAETEPPAASPTAAAVDASPTTALGIATPTAAPSEEPTAEEGTEVPETPTPEPPTPTIEPTPTPLVGDFGDLPAPDMPSGNSARRPITLDYRLDLSLQLVPTEAPVYALQHRAWTLEEVEAVATALGIESEVVDQGGGSFRTADGSLYISGDLVRYINSAPDASGEAELPGDDALIQMARNWLIEHRLVGADAGPGSVRLRDEDAGRAIVAIKPVEPESILSAAPEAAVTLTADGTVLQADVQWPAALNRSDYGLRSAEDLWNDIRAGRGYLEIDPAALPASDGALTGSANLTSVSLAYSLAGSPATQQFLVPLVVFAGQAEIEGADGPIPIKVYVPAVGAQVAPRG
jgi:hypothetical protein